MKKNNKGFTLVELIVVIAILGVLMAVLVPQYIQYVEKSRQSTDALALGEIVHAVETEVALHEDVTATTTVTISVATTGNVTIDSSLDALETAVESIVGTDNTIVLKSKAAKASAFTIILTTADSGITYNDDAEDFIKALSNGTATTTTPDRPTAG